MVSSDDSETISWSYFWYRRKAFLLLFLWLVPCFYWSYPLSCKRSSSSVLAPVLLAGKESSFWLLPPLLHKVDSATLWMTGILHGKDTLTALLGYCSVQHMKKCYYEDKIFLYDRQKKNLHKYWLKTQSL